MMSTVSVLYAAFILRITVQLAKYIETYMFFIANLISKEFSIILFKPEIFGLCGYDNSVLSVSQLGLQPCRIILATALETVPRTKCFQEDNHGS